MVQSCLTSKIGQTMNRVPLSHDAKLFCEGFSIKCFPFFQNTTSYLCMNISNFMTYFRKSYLMVNKLFVLFSKHHPDLSFMDKGPSCLCRYLKNE